MRVMTRAGSGRTGTKMKTLTSSAAVIILLLLLLHTQECSSAGSSSSSAASSSNTGGHSNALVRGAKASFDSTADFWKNQLQKAKSTVIARPNASERKAKTQATRPSTPPAFLKVFQSKQKKKEQALLETLKTMPVQQVVVVPNSTVLPAEVVHLAAKRAQMLGHPLRTDRVQDFAAACKRWYTRQGYILHSVTGATLRPESATAEIAVQEPVIAQDPVQITCVKELVVDDETGDLLTFRQYKDMHSQRKTLGHEKINKDSVNTTLVETTGRTKSTRIASALGLQPGQPFSWNSQRWRRIASSGIFLRILRAAPAPQADGTVQLHIVVQEAPTRHLQYGIGKSLYTGAWEGEMDLQHANVLGGGEHLGLSVSRGAKDAEASVKLKFSNDKFGLEGGYDVEAFSDYIGGHTKKNVGGGKKKGKGKSKDDEAEDNTSSLTGAAAATTEDDTAAAAVPTKLDHDDDADTLKSRRGATFRLRNPIDPSVIRNSMVSASLERTMTKSGVHEDIGSTRVSVGPFVKELPLDARSDMDLVVTTGARVAKSSANSANSYLVSNLNMDDDQDENVGSTTTLSSSSSSFNIRPYASVTATTKQIFPLVPTSTQDRRPVLLALRHSVSTSTRTLPRHDAQSLGIANEIRGASSTNGAISSAIRGTSELRVPVDIPHIKNITPKQARQDLSVVLFNDWIVGAKDTTSPIFRKSSVGVGLRKTIQGLPVQYNLCYSNAGSDGGGGKIKSTFGLGRDFDV